jgi:hypothetical protein
MQAPAFPSRTLEFKAAMDRGTWEDMLRTNWIFHLGRN